MGDAEYSLLFLPVVLPVVRRFDPDFVLIAAGFDATEGDGLPFPQMKCNYNLSPSWYGHMVQVC